MRKKFKTDDVCVMLHRNIVSQCDIGDIVIVSQDYLGYSGEEVEVEINKKEVVFMLPGFLKKIGVL